MIRKCVLIADGDVQRARACADLLKEAGYTVVVAHTGSEVLETLGETRPDLILLGLGPEYVLASVRRLAGSPLLEFGTGCGLCGGTSRESLLSFVHLRQGERVVLELPVCESCGNRLEKHLKRAIPKRLMRIEPVYF